MTTSTTYFLPDPFDPNHQAIEGWNPKKNLSINKHWILKRKKKRSYLSAPSSTGQSFFTIFLPQSDLVEKSYAQTETVTVVNLRTTWLNL